VSPALVGNHVCNGNALDFRVSRSHTENIPRGAYAPRSYFAVRTFAGEKTIFAMHERTFTRAAGVSPPWYGEPNAVAQKSRTVQRPRDAGTRAAGVSPPWVSGKRTCRNASAKSPGTAGGVLTNAGGVAVANHGGLTPPRSWWRCERFIGEKNDFCDARTHIHKSGGRQPAVGVSNAIAVADAFVQRPASARRGCANRVCNGNAVNFGVSNWCPDRAPRGAYAPRSWCSANVCRRKNDFCDARTQVHKSGGRYPAVVR
jgi:hypothetical protein